MQYEKAIRLYEKEIKRLNKAIGSIQRGNLLGELLHQPQTSEQGWFWKMQQLPDVAENRYLLHLLAGNEFNEALKNYRDLQYLDVNLAHWQQSIGSFDLMLANRRERFFNHCLQSRENLVELILLS